MSQIRIENAHYGGGIDILMYPDLKRSGQIMISSGSIRPRGVSDWELAQLLLSSQGVWCNGSFSQPKSLAEDMCAR